MRGRFRTRLRTRGVLLALLLGAGLVLAVTAGSASTPSSQSVAVPSTVGQSATVNWTGTIPPGSHGTRDCATVSGDPTADHHGIEITVPAGIYSSVTRPSVLDHVDARDADGGHRRRGPDPPRSQRRRGRLEATEAARPRPSPVQNLAAGTYDVLACGFVNALPQSYTGSLTITTSAP